MRKVFALILALVMVLSLGTVAMAAAPGGSTNVGGLGDNNIGDVIVKVSEGSVTNVYSITIEWENMTFNYSTAGKIWSPSTHDYIDKDEADWVGDNTAEIRVINYSDVAITVSGSVADENREDGFVATLSNSFNLASYATRNNGDPDKGIFTLTVDTDGNPRVTGSEGISIGTININIAKQ